MRITSVRMRNYSGNEATGGSICRLAGNSSSFADFSWGKSTNLRKKGRLLNSQEPPGNSNYILGKLELHVGKLELHGGLTRIAYLVNSNCVPGKLELHPGKLELHTTKLALHTP
jgi:hypothetical protein